MPIYEYQCRKCKERLERLQGIHDRDLSKCPSCGGTLDKLMSPAGFILKGTGWYATDYAGKGNGGGNGSGRKAKKDAPACGAAAGGETPPACEGCPKAK